MKHRSASCWLLVLGASLAAPALENPFTALNVEAHGFASFGHLRSWGNDWLGETTEGTSEFWEAAANVVARPMDRLRLGAQLFVRDLGRYDNGIVQLDWAYSDWRAADAFGVQAGRIKFAAGLYNEVLDVDAARTPVFLPRPVYAVRTRDLYISTDGAKIYGVADPGAGRIEYQLFAGQKAIDERLGLGTYFVESGIGTQIDEIAYDRMFGGMLHWDTPIDGLALRASAADVQDLRVRAQTPALGLTASTDCGHYSYLVLSCAWEPPDGDWLFAAECARLRGRGETRVEPLGLVIPLRDDSGGAYVSATWHAQSWLELYAAVEASWADLADTGSEHTYGLVGAVNLLPRANWSLKAEYRYQRGAFDISPADASGGGEDVWHLLALKTTVDF